MIKKPEIIAHLNQVIDDKIHSIQLRYDDLNNDLTSDHKSSAGDKHETGRAMTQLEQEKLAGQLNQLQLQKETLAKIELKVNENIQFGSLIKASNGLFFISIGLGKIDINDFSVFCISSSSPIGQLLIGKKCNDEIQFNENKILILELL